MSPEDDSRGREARKERAQRRTPPAEERDAHRRTVSGGLLRGRSHIREAPGLLDAETVQPNWSASL